MLPIGITIQDQDKDNKIKGLKTVVCVWNMLLGAVLATSVMRRLFGNVIENGKSVG